MKEQWISVKDRLPDEYEEYIVNGPNVTTMEWTELGWYSDVIGHYVDQKLITHWMPLPDPPKGLNQ